MSYLLVNLGYRLRSIKSPVIPSLSLPPHMQKETGPIPGDRTMKLASIVWTAFPQNLYIPIVEHLSIKDHKLQMSAHTNINLCVLINNINFRSVFSPSVNF